MTGKPAQLRAIALLDGREERIEVDVEDRSLGHGPGIIAPATTDVGVTRAGGDDARRRPPIRTRRRPVDRAELIDGVLIPAGLFVLAVAVYAWLNNGREAQLDYFVPLADAFLHGRLGLTEMPGN